MSMLAACECRVYYVLMAVIGNKQLLIASFVMLHACGKRRAHWASVGLLLCMFTYLL